MLPVVGLRQALLPGTVDAVVHEYLDRDALPRQGRLDLALIDPLDYKRDHVVPLLDPLGHPPGPPDRVRFGCTALYSLRSLLISRLAIG